MTLVTQTRRKPITALRLRYLLNPKCRNPNLYQSRLYRRVQKNYELSELLGNTAVPRSHRVESSDRMKRVLRQGLRIYTLLIFFTLAIWPLMMWRWLTPLLVALNWK